MQNQFMQPARVLVMVALRKYVHHCLFHGQLQKTFNNLILSNLI